MIFPSENEKLITATIISFILGLGLGISTTLENDTLITSIATLAAAFLGATTAFWLAHKKQEKDRIDDQVSAGNKAIFDTLTIYNTFINFRLQFIEAHLTDPENYISIPPCTKFIGSVAFDFRSLNFLFNCGDPDIVGELFTLQKQVEATAETIQKRSDFHLNNVQPAFENAGLPPGENIPSGELSRLLGERTLAIMKATTQDMINDTNSIIERSHSLAERLHNTLARNFKKRGILGLKSFSLKERE